MLWSCKFCQKPPQKTLLDIHELTSKTAWQRSALSKLQYDRLAPLRLAFFRTAYLKLIYLKSSLDKLALVKFMPWIRWDKKPFRFSEGLMTNYLRNCGLPALLFYGMPITGINFMCWFSVHALLNFFLQGSTFCICG